MYCPLNTSYSIKKSNTVKISVSLIFHPVLTNGSHLVREQQSFHVTVLSKYSPRNDLPGSSSLQKLFTKLRLPL